MLVLLLAATGLSGCGSTSGPIAWYRDLSGASANDAKDKAPNEANLAAGSKEPYPNLASVPSPPDNAITRADRKKMAQSLLADRQNAQYTDQQLRAGQNMDSIAPPVVAATPATAQIAAAAPPAAVSARNQPAPARPIAAPRAPVHEETLPTAESSPPPPPADIKKTAAKKNKNSRAKQASRRGAEAPPQESSLRPPSIDNLPEGEQARAAPPAPVEAPIARRGRPVEVAAATAPVRGGDEASHAHGGSGPVAEIKFAPPPFRARILPAGRKRLTEVARMAEQRNLRIRVVGYGKGPSNANKQQRKLESFNAALDNAKAVGIELARLGVPAGRIDIETSTDVNAPDHAEIFVEY